MAQSKTTFDYGRVILSFLCLYFRLVQDKYQEKDFNPLMMRFKQQCNEVIKKTAASFQLELAQIALDFHSQDSGFRLEMRFKEMIQAQAFWEVIEAYKRFSPLDLSDLLKEDPQSQIFPIVLLANQSRVVMQEGVISLDLPAYRAFISEMARWQTAADMPPIQ